MRICNCFTRTHAAACSALLLLLAAHGALARPLVSLQGPVAEIKTSRYIARLNGGSLIYFKDRSTGEVLLRGNWLAPQVWFVKGRVAVDANAASARSLSPRRVGPDTIRFTGSMQRDTSVVLVSIDVKAREYELVITGHARATGKFEGLASMCFPMGATMPHTQVIVPTNGGNCYSSSGLRTAHSFQWPMGWEAAVLQIQGRRGGLLVSAFEPFRRFKNLAIAPAESGWNVVLESENDAPFEGKREVESLAWHIRPYNGEWRRGASIYRDWHRATFRPTPAEEPAWVQETRAEIHCGTDPAVLDALVKAGVDPAQTLLYVAHWRTNPYDINYPDYTPADHLAPFIQKAHALGFRVMLHANYFGCDPKTPDYARFAPFQIKQKYSGERQWWEWTGSEPNTKFAYIDPASRDWRRLFVARMAELIGRTGADAVHLDQTLVIFNDNNGLMENLNCAQGNLLLHEELKAVLPQVAFSGEGLNEVTMVHEAFAQRHVVGIDFFSGASTRSSLKESHPISAYLFGGRTKAYNYLGCPSPDNDQVYLAWRDAYRHWGVLPGFGWPTAKGLADPSPFARQALDEIKLHQKNRLTPWTDGPWPAGVDFPYRSDLGGFFAYLSNPDGWSLCSADAALRPGETFSRTIVGVDSVKLPGTVPGSVCYDAQTISGLVPSSYYVCFPEPRGLDAFHLEPLTASGASGSSLDPRRPTIESSCAGPTVAFARIQASSTLVDFTDLLARSTTYYLAPDGKKSNLTSDLIERTGALVQSRGTGLFMHPQWKGAGTGTGMAGIAFHADLPSDRPARFRANCRIDDGAVGKSDGVVFTLRAECAGKRISAEAKALSAAPVPLDIDLSAFAGKRVKLDLIISAGPKHDTNCDWGLVEDIRVTASGSPVRYKPVWPRGIKYILSPKWEVLGRGGASQPVEIPSGGAVIGTSMEPAVVDESAKLSTVAQCNQVVCGGGPGFEQDPIKIGAASSGGMERPSFYTHPPDHGMRLLHYCIRMPKGAKAALKTAVGIKDGSKSTGVRFAVWLNGREIWSKRLLPSDGWQPVDIPLTNPDGEPFMLTLVTDSDGSYSYDWALWADPEIVLL